MLVFTLLGSRFVFTFRFRVRRTEPEP